MNTRVEYLYRDGSNYKQWGGDLSRQLRCALASTAVRRSRVAESSLSRIRWDFLSCSSSTAAVRR